MNSPFQKRFMSKSPLRSHGRRLKKLDKKIAKADTYDKGGDKDYDYLADLQRQRKDLVASHTDTSTKRTEEEDVQVREDEDAAQGSAVEMQSPLHGYVDASDMVDPNPPTAHMWTKVFDAAGDAYKSAIAPKNPCEGLTGDALQDCKNKQYTDTQTDTNTDTTTNTTTDEVDTTATDVTVKDWSKYTSWLSENQEYTPEERAKKREELGLN
jgi:hypothetical protein